jgi:hypothetical protein
VILSFLHDHPELESCNIAQVPDDPPEPSQAVVQLSLAAGLDRRHQGQWSLEQLLGRLATRCRATPPGLAEAQGVPMSRHAPS